MVDEKKRRFLKHLGLVSGAGILGLAISQGAGSVAEVLIDDLEESEQHLGYRYVWATKRDQENNFGRTYAEYLDDALKLGIWECGRCSYIYDVTDGLVARFDELPSTWVCDHCGEATKEDFKKIGIAMRSGGQPLVNEVACAFHYDIDGDGIYEGSEEGVYCTMPCKTICPVEAVSKGPLSTITEGAKIGPIVSFSDCIGCTRCHKICGYNSIEWVNVAYKSTGGAGSGD